MIDRVSEFGTSAAQPLEEGDITHKTAGDLLREAREAHGLHIEMVAAALKVPPQKLLALEADDIASLPDPVFARALASSVCRALRIDPAPVLAKLPTTQKVSLAAADRTLKTNISSGTPRWAGNGRSSGGLPSRALLTVVVLLLIGAGIGLPWGLMDGLAVSVVPRERAGMASGIFNTVRVAGEGIALALVGAGLTALVTLQLGAFSAASQAAQRVTTGDLSQALALLPGVDRAALLHAYGVAFGTLLCVLAGVTVLTALVVFAFLRGDTHPETSAAALESPAC